MGERKEDYVEVRVGGELFWIETPEPTLNLRTMEEEYQTYARRIGGGSYAAMRFLGASEQAAILAAIEHIIEGRPRA